MRLLVVLASLVLAVNAATDKELWVEFKQNFGREYRNLREEQVRFSIFQDTLRTIESHNELYAKGEKTYYMGVNQFSDITPQEFKSVLNYSALARPNQKLITWHVESGLGVPNSINWASKGVVTGVKNQGDCGSCWAFSTTGAVEGAYAMKHGNLVSLSEQNLMDCSTVNGGCDGGWMQAGYEYIRDNGIESENDYPYKAVNGNCKYSSSKSVTRVSSYVNVPRNEGSLKEAVGTVGPVAIAINAGHFQNFAGGVFNEPACDGDDLNHGVLAVGYGKQDGLDYWLVKNSWGPQWGENGYVKMVRNHNNQCGIANDPSYPLV